MNESFNLHGASSYSMVYNRPFYRNDAASALLWAGFCAGICNIILFIIAICLRKFNKSNLTVLKVSLVIVSTLQSISTPPLAIELVENVCQLIHCEKLVLVWFQCRWSGMALHLLVALEFTLTCRSQKEIKTLPVYWTVPIVFIIQLISSIFFDFLEASVALGVIDLVIWIIFIIVSCFPSKIVDTRVRKVFLTVLVSFLATYFPSFVTDCMLLSHATVFLETYQIVLCLTNLRLLFDGYLCWVTSGEIPDSSPMRENLNLEGTVNPAVDNL